MRLGKSSIFVLMLITLNLATSWAQTQPVPFTLGFVNDDLQAGEAESLAAFNRIQDRSRLCKSARSRKFLKTIGFTGATTSLLATELLHNRAYRSVTDKMNALALNWSNDVSSKIKEILPLETLKEIIGTILSIANKLAVNVGLDKRTRTILPALETHLDTMIPEIETVIANAARPNVKPALGIRKPGYLIAAAFATLFMASVLANEKVLAKIYEQVNKLYKGSPNPLEGPQSHEALVASYLADPNRFVKGFLNLQPDQATPLLQSSQRLRNATVWYNNLLDDVSQYASVCP